ncbi:MAG: lysostaphin resistance A-like protein [Flavobacteriales bacterium AspAUS03]
MRKYFRVDYRRAIGITFMLIGLSLFITSLETIFSFLGLNLPRSILFPLLYISPFILFYLFISYVLQKERTTLGLSFRYSSWKVYLLIFPLIFCGMIAEHYISSAIPKEGPILRKMYQDLERVFEEETFYPVSLIVSTVLLAPLCEEIFFRGILLNGLLRNNIHPVKSILFSSFLFGLIHMNPWQFVGGFFIGNLLGLVYFCTRSMLNCILLHAFNNGFVILTHFLWKKKEDDDLVSIFLDANPCLFFVALLLALVDTYVILYQTKNQEKIDFHQP